MAEQIKLEVTTKKGSRLRVPAKIEKVGGRIEFLESPFALKDEIKAMRGSKWHGFEAENPRKIWSVEDCPRNWFQLRYLMGENPYEWFDRPVKRFDYHIKELMDHQKDMADNWLTYHYQVWAAEMGCGKTLAAQVGMELSGVKDWFWMGPKSSLPNIEREFRKWGMDPSINVTLMTYEALVKWAENYKPGDTVPMGAIGDESSKLKTESAQRTRAMQFLADLIREFYGYEGYFLLMTGTPSPKTPLDWWPQCEIVCPGYLKEGSPKSLAQRLAFLEVQDFGMGAVNKTIGWKDDANKCTHCGKYLEEGDHSNSTGYMFDPDSNDEPHMWEKSVNEVAGMYDRLCGDGKNFGGIVVVKHKKDCLTLPDKRYRRIYCKPNKSTLRVAQALTKTAQNAVTALTLLRELSDGFQYREEQDGTIKCNHCQDGTVEEWFDSENEDRTFSKIDMLNPELVESLEKRSVQCPKCDGSQRMAKMKRWAREVPCPKETVLKSLLEENEEVGRIVIFAGFTGSVDRVTTICRKEGWSVVRLDGRGYKVMTKDESVNKIEPLDYWGDLVSNPRVAFVTHPESGGMSLTLTEARTAVYWSNSFKPEYRSQSEDRIHRKGMDENIGCTIIDLIHLPTDERTLDILSKNRKLEKMTMGEVMDDIVWEETDMEELLVETSS